VGEANSVGRALAELASVGLREIVPPGGSLTDAPHEPQKRPLSGTSREQAGQRVTMPRMTGASSGNKPRLLTVGSEDLGGSGTERRALYGIPELLNAIQDVFLCDEVKGVGICFSAVRGLVL